jgi:hypothetical protein
MNTIRIDNIATFCEVVAGLQENGLRYNVTWSPESGTFVIEITGH